MKDELYDYTIAPSLGTTTIAAIFDGGVYLAADSRTSQGIYISDRSRFKVNPLFDNIYVLNSGNAAHSEIVRDVARKYTTDLAFQLGDIPPVKASARIIQNFLYKYKQLESTSIVAGWDQEGPHVYHVTQGGSLIQDNICFAGSGSSYISGYLDENYRVGLSKNEVRELLIKAITLAIKRDSSSGGLIRLVSIDNSNAVRETEFIDV